MQWRLQAPVVTPCCEWVKVETYVLRLSQPPRCGGIWEGSSDLGSSDLDSRDSLELYRLSALRRNHTLTRPHTLRHRVMASNIEQSPFFQEQKSKGEIVVKGMT